MADRILFVAMPFRAKYDPVLATVKEAAEILSLRVVQVGEEAFAGSIISQIWSSIESADLMVAIITEENGNVYYEIGLGHCQKKPVVLLTDDPNSLKFDLRDHRAIIYDRNDPHGIRDELIRTFQAALETTSDPNKYLAKAFGTVQDGGNAGLQRAVQAITREAHLQEPVSVKQMHVLDKTNELAVEVTDFLGTRVRAVIDVNGIIRVLKQL